MEKQTSEPVQEKAVSIPSKQAQQQSQSSNFASFLSKGILQNIVICIMFAVVIWLFTKRNSTTLEIKELTKRIEEQEATIERHEMVLKKIMTLIGNRRSSTPSVVFESVPERVVEKPVPKAPTPERVVDRVPDIGNIIASMMVPMIVQPDNDQPPQQQSQPLVTIEELDSELSDELVDLNNKK